MLRDPRLRLRLWRSRKRAQKVDKNFIGFDKYRLSGAYHWRELDENPSYRRKVDLIIDRLDPGQRVLDIGCGDGAYLSLIAGASREAVGVDADEDAVRLANEHLSAAGISNVTCKQMVISAIPGADLGGTFDVAYSMDVIEHLPDPAELVQAAAAVLRPNGILIVGTPLYLGEDLLSPYHVREFRRAEIADLLKRHLQVDEELILPDKRLDGHVHDEAFYVGVCRRT